MFAPLHPQGQPVAITWQMGAAYRRDRPSRDLARSRGIPFYVAAPSSTFDLELAGGDQIPIEQRDPRKVTHAFGRQTAWSGIDVYNPAFDVTPARLTKAIVTERGVIDPVNAPTIRRMLA